MSDSRKGVFLGWFGVFRLGLVQTSLGAIVVLTTSTINRIMVVELALPALLPGLLVGLHYAIQITRPRLGYGSDQGGKRTPWIIGGMAILATGGALAAMSTSLIQTSTVAGIGLAIVAFVLVGIGVGCAGTSLLVMLAKSVAPRYRGASATTLWIMMIMGFIVTAVVAGKHLDPFSFSRLITISVIVSAGAFVVSTVAVWGLESRVRVARAGDSAFDEVAHEVAADSGGFSAALKAVWAEPEARKFSVFVFISMLAYSAQDLILEPFAGAVFSMTPGESTQLSGAQHGGVLLGMLAVALASSLLRGTAFGSLRSWTIGGCAASAIMLTVLAFGGLMSAEFPLRQAVFLLGVANGAFAVAAIGSMMDLVGRGGKRREGVRMGMWGAAQAIAFGLGGLLATGAVDLSRLLMADVEVAYAIVFVMQAGLFLVAALLARGVWQPQATETSDSFPPSQIAVELNR